MTLRKMSLALSLVAPVLSALAAADEVMPTVPRRIDQTQPDDTALQITSERRREMDAIEKEMKERRRAFETGQPQATQETAPVQRPGAPVGGGVEEEAPSEASAEPQGSLGADEGDMERVAGPKAPPPSFKRSVYRTPSGSPGPQVSTATPGAKGRPVVPLGTPLQVFTVSKVPEPEPGTTAVLPTGSHVKARIVSGVEANAREPYPVLLQLDHAFTGPNKTRIDLSHCFMIAKARANLSTERVMMETESLSCVRENGEHFKREAKGFVAGEDNTFGATGTYISKQGQVLLAAVLASIAKNAGQAIAESQRTTSIAGADKAATASNITGSKAAFVAGSAIVDGGAMVAQWYLEQAKELLPAIGVGSGQDVFVVMLDSIKVPYLQAEEFGP